MNTFIRTDDTQWVRREAERQFTVIEVTECPDDATKQLVQVQSIDIDDYTEDEIIEYINGYVYDSIEIVKQQYGADAYQVIAECISEMDQPIEKDIVLTLLTQEAVEYLMTNYGIKAEL